MPIYKYQCYDCGLKFEKSVKFAERGDPQKCVCGVQAKPLMPDKVSFSFKQKAGGIVPQNTGVSSFDAHTDRVIGSHSEESWQVIEERHREKKRILQANPGVSGKDISRTDDGEYRIMQPQERQASDTAKELHNTALTRISAHQAAQKTSDR